MITAPGSRLVLAFVLALTMAIAARGIADDKSGPLRFGVGPLQPTTSETKKAYEPFFAYLARQLNREFDLVASLYKRPGYGPAEGVEHLELYIPDGYLTPDELRQVDELAERVFVAHRAGARPHAGRSGLSLRCSHGRRSSGNMCRVGASRAASSNAPT